MVGPPAPGASAGTCSFTFKSSEKAFARRTNNLRSSKGLERLRLDPELSREARFHTREMIRAGRLYHTSLAQFRRRVLGWSWIGENVGNGPGVDNLQRTFIGSPEHYDNLVARHYRYIGVGVVRHDGLMWVTVQFSAYANPSTSLPVCPR
jgi:uncharacterized protein YkwD